MEVLEDLLIDNLKVYQDDELYRFTSDSVLLSKFAKVKKGDVVADFCAGSGIVGLHLYALNKNLINSVTLFEMQKSLYDLSLKSIEYNRLGDKFCAVNTRLQDLGASFAGKFSLIVCNPPYMSVDSGAKDEKKEIAMCKSELTLTLRELIKAISVSLKYGGRTCIVHRADRLADIFYEMKKEGIEPKKIQLVSGSAKKEPYLVLVEGVKGGRSGLKVLGTIIN